MITELCIATDHPAYSGHFPGFPIFPGAALLDEALYTIAAVREIDLLQWQITAVKFLQIVRPGDSLVIELSESNDLIRFVIRSSAGEVACGTLSVIAKRREIAHGG